LKVEISDHGRTLAHIHIHLNLLIDFLTKSITHNHTHSRTQMAATHMAMQHQGSWLQQLGLERQTTDITEQQEAASWLLPPQQATLQQLQVRGGRGNRGAYSIRERAQLIGNAARWTYPTSIPAQRKDAPMHHGSF